MYGKQNFSLSSKRIFKLYSLTKKTILIVRHTGKFKVLLNVSRHFSFPIFKCISSVIVKFIIYNIYAEKKTICFFKNISHNNEKEVEGWSDGGGGGHATGVTLKLSEPSSGLGSGRGGAELLVSDENTMGSRSPGSN